MNEGQVFLSLENSRITKPIRDPNIMHLRKMAISNIVGIIPLKKVIEIYS